MRTIAGSIDALQFTPNTITDERKLQEQYDQIRSQGYAIEREESALQGCCISVPIVDEDGSVNAGVSISLPTMRYTDAKQARVISALRNVAQHASGGLRAASHV